MSIKRIFLDTETTGLDPFKNDIIELGGVIETEEAPDVIFAAEEFLFKMAPRNWDSISEEALKINKTTVEELKSYPPPMVVYDEFIGLLDKYIDRYDKKDKFIFIGWNVYFDWNFLRSFFTKSGNKYFGSWFFWPPLGVECLAIEKLIKNRWTLENFHLSTVAEKLKIEQDSTLAHSALYDASVTRDVYYAVR